MSKPLEQAGLICIVGLAAVLDGSRATARKEERP